MDINCGACRNSIKVYCKKTMVRRLARTLKIKGNNYEEN